MEKNPDKRFQNAAVMRKHVEQMLANPGYIFSNRKMSAIPAAKGIKGVFAKMARKKPKAKRRNGSMLPVIAGICFAIVIILAVALVNIVIDLFKDDTVKTTIVVENYINQIYSDDLKLELEGMGYNVIVDYTDNSNYEPYTIVRQKPVAGSKKAFVEGKTKVDITFTICRDKNSMTMQLPDYKMKDYRTVEINAENIGLKTTVKFESHDLIPEGMVLRTDPEAGTVVTRGDLITLYVSQGPDLKMAKMPKLVGKTIEQAQQLLRSFQLNLGEPTYQDSDRPKGEILEQSVAEGVEVATGSEVFVIVSKGPAETTAPDDGKAVIPDLKGKTPEAAMTALRDAGFIPSNESDYSDNVAAGLVIKTFPAAGERIRKGETVTIYISNGKKPETAPETKPPETLPEVTEAETTQPVVTQPVVTQPVVTQPVQTQPVQTQPEQTQPVQTQPEQTAAGSP
jgi:serine/threonine-protein kinase